MNPFQFYPVDREAMNRFLSICERKQYKSKTVVVRPGDPGESLFYVIEGSLVVSTEGEDGRELILSYLNPGDFIGELGVFMKPRAREVLVRTRTRCELAEIPYPRFHEALNDELKDCAVEVMTAIGSKTAQRLLQARRKVSHLAFYDTQGRVAKALIDLCDEPDALSHPEGTQIKTTRQEISRIVGCSREMAGRVMKSLEDEGMIRANGKTIVVLGKHKSAPG